MFAPWEILKLWNSPFLNGLLIESESYIFPLISLTEWWHYQLERKLGESWCLMYRLVGASTYVHLKCTWSNFSAAPFDANFDLRTGDLHDSCHNLQTGPMQWLNLEQIWPEDISPGSFWWSRFCSILDHFIINVVIRGKNTSFFKCRNDELNTAYALNQGRQIHRYFAFLGQLCQLSRTFIAEGLSASPVQIFCTALLTFLECIFVCMYIFVCILFVCMYIFK